MGHAIAEYFIKNYSDLIKDTVFLFLGAIVGLWLTPRDNNPRTSNGSSLNQTLNVIYQTRITNVTARPRATNRRRNQPSSSEDVNPIVLLGGGLILIAFLYIKFHAEIMDFLSGFILFALTCTITAAILLYKKNNYDRLNMYWTALLLLLICVNIVTLGYMNKQNVTGLSFTSLTNFVQTLGLNTAFKWGYYAIGFLTMQVANTLLLILLIHMFAINSFLSNQNRLSAWIIRKTNPLVLKPIRLSVAVSLTCIVSLLFTSGILYEAISNLNVTS